MCLLLQKGLIPFTAGKIISPRIELVNLSPVWWDWELGIRWLTDCVFAHSSCCRCSSFCWPNNCSVYTHTLHAVRSRFVFSFSLPHLSNATVLCANLAPAVQDVFVLLLCFLRFCSVALCLCKKNTNVVFTKLAQKDTESYHITT